MLSLVKEVYSKYCFLVVKMHVKSARSDGAGKNLNSLCAVEVI
jgi:hypothetical protein